jgi:hypothetical protein
MRPKLVIMKPRGAPEGSVSPSPTHQLFPNFSQTFFPLKIVFPLQASDPTAFELARDKTGKVNRLCGAKLLKVAFFFYLKCF